MKQKFKVYNDELNKKIIKVRYRYIEPPEWIASHPRLLERYEKIMVKFTNPEEVTQSLDGEEGGDDGRAWLEVKFQELYRDKYEPMIEKMWNEGRKEELIANKKQMEIEFYNDSTRLLE